MIALKFTLTYRKRRYKNKQTKKPLCLVFCGEGSTIWELWPLRLEQFVHNNQIMGWSVNTAARYLHPADPGRSLV